MMHTVSTKDVVKISNKIEQFLINDMSGIDVEISGLMVFLKDFVSLVVQSSITSIAFSIIIIMCISWILYEYL